MIEDVFGEGSTASDKVMVMTVCGVGPGSDQFEENGVSQETGPDGTWFRLPRPLTFGKYRVCWCAGESLCVTGKDFAHDLGELRVGGPDRSALYTCYEWQPCTINGLKGADFTDGDRLYVVYTDVNCSAPNLTDHVVAGWPKGGLGEPSTLAGTVHTWGTDVPKLLGSGPDQRIRSKPGLYSLCWCSARATGGNCTSSASYDQFAGQMRIGTAEEWNFVSRPPDPEERTSDYLYAIFLLAPLVLVAAALAILGWRRVTNRNNRFEPQAKEPFPKKKAWTAAEQERLKTHHAVFQVRSQRELALGTADEDKDQRAVAVAIPNYSGLVADQLSSVLAGQKEIVWEEEVDAATALADKREERRKSMQALRDAEAKSDQVVPIDDREEQIQAAGTADLSAAGAQADASRKSSKSGIMSRLSRSFSRKSSASTGLEVREIRQSGTGLSSLDSAAEQSGGGNRLVMPVSPTANWRDEWDEEDDGPMPPSMEFDLQRNARKKDLLVKILDL